MLKGIQTKTSNIQCWKAFAIILLFFTIVPTVYAQSPNKVSSKNAVYFELLGSSFYLYNIGYDRIIYSKRKNRLAFALGLQIQDPINLDANNSISPQLNYLYGNIHSLEVGVGYTYYAKQVTPNGIIFRFGYRYQKKKKLFFKAAITPIITDGFAIIGIPILKDGLFLIPWGGLSIGYSF